MLDQSILQLVEYGVRTGLLPERERIYAANLLIELYGQKSLDLDAWKGEADPVVLPTLLDSLLEEAVSRGIIEDTITERDLFDAKLMNTLIPRPSQVDQTFASLYEQSSQAATDWFYEFSQDTNYIRRDRIARDEHWLSPSPYGELELSINLSKPEKDPAAIAAAKTIPQTGYPKCQLCMENEGYAGNLNHPGRSNHRIISLTIQGNPWGFQYSPYVYFNEHCIVFNARHVPMTINHHTFEKLLDFVDLFPHYFLGSNADLPIVGGSILSHDHFQGGCHEFPMAKAPIEKETKVPGFEKVEAGIIAWPMSVLRLRSTDRQELVRLADHVLDTWRSYNDECAFIFASTDGQPHNTITPIARKKEGVYELDLVLRNNITTSEHPLGVFHPHQECHHIKKENIGLIEVMGLAILPARLKREMEELKKAMIEGADLETSPLLAKHAVWARQIQEKYPDMNSSTIDQIVADEIGLVFNQVLEDAGVFKRDEAGRKAFLRFVEAL